MRAPARRRPYRLCRLRDRALVALLDHPDLEAAQVRTLQAAQIRQHGESGRLVVDLAPRQGSRLALLSAAATAALLEYLEAARLWGEPRPLFEGRDGGPLSASAVRTVRNRLENRD